LDKEANRILKDPKQMGAIAKKLQEVLKNPTDLNHFISL
jgi:hypothetical protein